MNVFIAWFVRHVFGDSPLALRLLPAIVGAALEGAVSEHKSQPKHRDSALHLRQHLMHEVNRDRFFADGRRHALHIAGPDIPHRKHPRQAGLEKLQRARQRPPLKQERATRCLNLCLRTRTSTVFVGGRSRPEDRFAASN